MRKHSALIISIATLLTCTTLAHAKVYKYINEEGSVVYSDQPHPDAEVLNIKPLHPYKAPSYQIPEKSEKSSSDELSVDASSRYSSVTIDSPEHESNFHGTAGSFSVSVSSNPSLKKGDKYQLLINGKPIGEPTTLSQFNVQNINRGEHTLSVQVLNKQGKSLIKSPSITVFVHRPSVKRN